MSNNYSLCRNTDIHVVKNYPCVVHVEENVDLKVRFIAFLSIHMQRKCHSSHSDTISAEMHPSVKTHNA